MNTTYAQEQASLAGVLRERILDYKKARPNLSSQQIATKFGMSSSTFNRIENLDIKTPTFDQVIKVFNGTGCRGDLLAYLKGNYPEIAQAYLGHYPQSESGASIVSNDIKKYLVDPSTSKLMILAFSKCGLCRDQVKEEFGNDGIRSLDFLIDQGVLVKKGERYFPREKGTILSQKDTKYLCEHTLKQCYDLRGLEEERAANYMTFQSESIDIDKAYPLIIGLLKEVNQRVREIFNNSEFEGDDTVFVSLVSDTVLTNDLRRRNNLKKRNLQ